MTGLHSTKRTITLVLGMRLIIPFLCVGEVLTDPRHSLIALVLAGVGLTDILFQFLWPPQDATGPSSLKAVSLRDAGYALVFYWAYLHNPQVPALLLAPLVLAEMMVSFPLAVAKGAIALEMGLLGFRIFSLDHYGHPFIHPSWPIGVGIATLVAYLLGRQIKEVAEANYQALITKQRAKAVMAAILEEARKNNNSGRFASSGILDGMDALLDQACDEWVSEAQCQEIASHLSSMLKDTMQQEHILTEREREVLALMCQGHSYRQIARLLVVSEGTVRAHAASIMRKAQVHNRQDVLAWAKSHNLLPQ